MSISITTCINNHHNMHYKHMFLRGTYGFNQFFSGSEHYTDICYAYTGNVIIFTFHYKREFLIYIFTGKRRYNFFYIIKKVFPLVESESHSTTKCFSSSTALPHKKHFLSLSMVFLCLPFSIWRSRELILSLANVEISLFDNSLTNK